MPKQYPAEVRRAVVAVARKHEAPLAQIAEDFGISEAEPKLERLRRENEPCARRWPSWEK